MRNLTLPGNDARPHNQRLALKGRRLGLWCAVIWMVATPAISSPIADVRTVYLVPSDASFDPSYLDGIVNALEDIRDWYATELGGPTFRLHDPIVEVFSTFHPRDYYATTPNGEFFLWFWNNVVADGFALTGARFDDPSHAWVFYIDADPIEGQYGGAATTGVAVLPRWDLLGVAGQGPEPIERWIGGLGHELGHAFGVPHPPDCELALPSCPANALMWLGYRLYPETFLLPEDRATLLASRYIAPAVPEPAVVWLLTSGLAAFVVGQRKLRRRTTRTAWSRRMFTVVPPLPEAARTRRT